jgi:hypothetical protein
MEKPGILTKQEEVFVLDKVVKEEMDQNYQEQARVAVNTRLGFSSLS